MTLDQFVQHMEKREEIEELIKQREQDSRADKKNEAKKKLREVAYQTLKDVGHPGIDYSRETPDSIGEDHVNIGIKSRIGMESEDSSRVFDGDYDSIVDAIPVESLEKIAMTKPIREYGESGYSELLNIYQEFLSIKDLADRYDKGKITDPRELQILTGNAAEKVKGEIRKKMKDKGYSADLQDLISNIASVAARDGLVNEQYVKDGAKQLVTDTEKKLRDYENDKGKSIVDYVKGSLVKLKSGKSDEYNLAKELVYRVITGKLDLDSN